MHGGTWPPPHTPPPPRPSSGDAPPPSSPPTPAAPLLSPVRAPCWGSALSVPGGCFLCPPPHSPSCPHRPRGSAPSPGDSFFRAPSSSPGALPLPSVVTICPQPYPHFFLRGGTNKMGGEIWPERCGCKGRGGRRGAGAGWDPQEGLMGVEGARCRPGCPCRWASAWRACPARTPLGTRPHPGVPGDLLAVPPGRRSTPKDTRSPQNAVPQDLPLRGCSPHSPAPGWAAPTQVPPLRRQGEHGRGSCFLFLSSSRSWRAVTGSSSIPGHATGSGFDLREQGITRKALG